MYDPQIHSHKFHKFMNLSNAELFALHSLIWEAKQTYFDEYESLPDSHKYKEDGERVNAFFKMGDHFICFTGSELARRREAAEKGKAEWLTKEEEQTILKTGTTMPAIELAGRKGMTFQEYQTHRDGNGDTEE